MTTLVTPDSDRRTDIIQYLRHYFYEHGRYPTQRELADHFDVYQNAIRGHLVRLQQGGWLEGVAMGSHERNRFQLRNIWTSLRPSHDGMYWLKGSVIELVSISKGVCSSLINHRKPTNIELICDRTLWSLRPVNAAPTQY